MSAPSIVLVRTKKGVTLGLSNVLLLSDHSTLSIVPVNLKRAIVAKDMLV